MYDDADHSSFGPSSHSQTKAMDFDPLKLKKRLDDSNSEYRTTKSSGVAEWISSQFRRLVYVEAQESRRGRDGYQGR